MSNWLNLIQRRLEITSEIRIQTKLSHHSSTARKTVPIMYPSPHEKRSPKIFWMESPKKTEWANWKLEKWLTNIFSRSTRIIPYPLQDKLRVTNNFPKQLQPKSQQEPKDPGVTVICAPEKLENQPKNKEAEAVGVQHVLGGLWGIPLLDIERPPCSFVPGHFGYVCRYWYLNLVI